MAAKFDLTPAKAYDTLVAFGKPSLRDQVWDGLPARLLRRRRGHRAEKRAAGAAGRTAGTLRRPLDADSRERLLTWMDTYAQRLGHFSDEQERELIELRRASAGLLLERQPGKPSRPSSAVKLNMTKLSTAAALGHWTRFAR